MLMEFVYLAGECTQASCDQVLQLLKVQQTLSQVVLEGTGGPAGAKRPSSKLPPVVQTMLQSCMTPTGVKSVLKGLSRWDPGAREGGDIHHTLACKHTLCASHVHEAGASRGLFTQYL